jgi:outer membrane protein OmpA-like peptidoglycan-associated protein
MNALVIAGIQASRLTAVGFGASKPLESNDTEDGKAKNRRVELVKRK